MAVTAPSGSRTFHYKEFTSHGTPPVLQRAICIVARYVRGEPHLLYGAAIYRHEPGDRGYQRKELRQTAIRRLLICPAEIPDDLVFAQFPAPFLEALFYRLEYRFEFGVEHLRGAEKNLRRFLRRWLHDHGVRGSERIPGAAAYCASQEGGANSGSKPGSVKEAPPVAAN